MNDNTEIVATADGSYTLKNLALNEHYHSVFGAVQESQWVFINAGLDFATRYFSKINIFELGLGTGLNLLLSLKFIEAMPEKDIHYEAIEPFPISADIARKLNYCQFAELTSYACDFELIHKCNPATTVALRKNFSFCKHHTKLDDFSYSSKYELVYYDAFSPEVQPEMWTEEVFAKIYTMCVSNAVLTTYCCKGSVKRALKSVGFTVEKLPGPPGKREILRALKV